MNEDYDTVMKAKAKVQKLPQVNQTHICGGSKDGNITHMIQTKTHDGRLFFIKVEDADIANEIINKK